MINILSLPNYEKSYLSTTHKDFGTNSIRKQAGHDTLFVLNNINSDNDSIYAVFDGHGVLGEHYSNLTCDLLISNILLIFSDIKSLINNKEALCSKINTLFIDTNEQVFNTLNRTCQLGHNKQSILNSGTTASIVLIVTYLGQHYQLSFNVGDSPIISYQNKTLKICHSDDNCDNIIAVQKYVDYLNENHPDTIPWPIYYSRINCGGLGDPIWPHITDTNGIPCPLTVYKYDQKVIIEPENSEKIQSILQSYDMPPCGTQSIRTPELYTNPDNELRIVPNQAAENWGSTLNGCLQCLTSFGDKLYYPHISVLPTIQIDIINNPITIVVASDGFTDLCYYDKFMEFICSNDINTNSLQDYLYTQASNHSNDYKIFRNLPKWDDVSCIVVKYT